MPQRKGDLLALLETVQGDVTRFDLGASIAPGAARPSRALQRLNELTRSTGQLGERLELGATLGRGGMGLVRLARQRSLDRNVAVKTILPECASEQATATLLREAWVTGGLEHPNIVPVYDLGTGTDGRPAVVLKRIEGASWDQLMTDADGVRERFGVSDLLAWNISILMQVINAVRFAHSRGIVHRDLKPANVMIGEFGEVYVLDWGLAVGVHQDALEAGEIGTSQPAGTPAYMAPEMLGGQTITERTDVYLLGGILFEMITGNAPHRAETMPELVDSIMASPPAIPEHAPAELAAICRRAMAAAAVDRFNSVGELRTALADYLTHRESSRLSDAAEDRLRRLERLIEGHPSSSGQSDASEIHSTFRECRFAFREALGGWDENPRARAGLRRAVLLMIDFELEHDEPRSASNLLTELTDPPPELVERVATALRLKQERDQHMAQLSAQHDLHTGMRTRLFLVAVLGAAWVLTPLMAALIGIDPMVHTYRRMVLNSSAFLVVNTALVYWARESLSKTVLNRRLALCALLVPPSNLVLLGGLWVLGLGPTVVPALVLFSWDLIATMLCLTTSAYLLPLPLAYSACFFLAARWPEKGLYFMSLPNVVMLVNVGLFSLRTGRGRASPS